MGDCFVTEDAVARAPCLRCIAERLQRNGTSVVGELDVCEADDGPLAAALADETGGEVPVRPLALSRDDGVSRHLALPVPGCAACAASQHRPAIGQEALGAGPLLDPLLGLVHIDDIWQSGESGRLCAGATASLSVPLDEPALRVASQAVSVEQALAGLIGEAVERYAALCDGGSDLIYATHRALAPRVPPLAALSDFSEQQLAETGWQRLGSETRMAFVAGERLADGQKLFVPAHSVLLTRRRELPEPVFGRLCSTGLAAGPSRDAALSAAAREVLERYRLTVGWHRGVLGRRLSLEVLPQEGRELVARLEAAGIELLLMLQTERDDVPVVLAAALAPAYPFVALGSACRLSLGGAALHAALEAAFAWDTLSAIPPEARERPLDGTSEAIAHPLYYAARPERAAELSDAIRRTPAMPPFDPKEPPHQRIFDELVDVAPDAAVVDITPPDCAWCGYTVVRVVAPGLPLFGFGAASAPRAALARFKLEDCGRPHPFP